MNELTAMFDQAALPPATVEVVAWTLLHFFWQGALVAVALAATLALLRRKPAHVRYAAACAALVTMAALPLLTGAWLSAGEAVPSATTIAAAPRPAPAHVAPPAAVAAAVEPAAVAASRWAAVEPALPWLVVVWLAGVAGLSCLHLGGWMRLRRLRRLGVRPAAVRWRLACERLARRLGIRRPVELLESTRLAVPAAVGWLKPVVLFPASTFTGLDARQLESILAHELAHVRRHDYLINVLQVALETLLFYHPAVWWASRQTRELREHCCDDLAVAVCGDRMAYARALADLEELRFAAPVFALGADGGSLLERIRRLAGGRATPPPVAPAWMAGALAGAALLAIAGVLAFAGPGFAQQDATEGAAVEDVEAPEVTFRGIPLLPPMVIAQVDEESAESGAGPASGESGASPQARPSRERATGTLPIPLDELIEMKRHGLDDLLEEVDGTAYASLPTAQLLEMARFGVDRELIAELDAAGYRDLPATELVELAKFGVDGELIGGLESAGYNQLTTAELVALAKFGVDAELISELETAGYGTLAIAELVELAKFGVDGDYIQEMRGAGYRPDSVSGLVALAKFGVDAELISELDASGFSGLPAADLVMLAKFGVDGDYIQEMRGAGYAPDSVSGLVALAKFGVDAELISEMAELGYRGLTAEDLIELAKFGVDGDYVRELRDAGYDGVTLEDLTRMARHGIDAEFLNKMKARQPI